MTPASCFWTGTSPELKTQKWENKEKSSYGQGSYNKFPWAIATFGQGTEGLSEPHSLWAACQIHSGTCIPWLAEARNNILTGHKAKLSRHRTRQMVQERERARQENVVISSGRKKINKNQDSFIYQIFTRVTVSKKLVLQVFSLTPNLRSEGFLSLSLH